MTTSNNAQRSSTPASELLTTPAQSWTEELGPNCQHPAGCEKRRYRFRGYCPDHDPNPVSLPPSRCQQPIRCYGPCCSGERWALGPAMTAPAIRAHLAAVRAAR